MLNISAVGFIFIFLNIFFAFFDKNMPAATHADLGPSIFERRL